MAVQKEQISIARRKAMRHTLSSGLFGLPGNAASVDRAVVNNSLPIETLQGMKRSAIA
jgi:hypothetical protein